MECNTDYSKFYCRYRNTVKSYGVCYNLTVGGGVAKRGEGGGGGGQQPPFPPLATTLPSETLWLLSRARSSLNFFCNVSILGCTILCWFSLEIYFCKTFITSSKESTNIVIIVSNIIIIQ